MNKNIINQAKELYRCIRSHFIDERNDSNRGDDVYDSLMNRFCELEKNNEITWRGRYKYFCGDNFTLVGEVKDIIFRYEGTFDFIVIEKPFFNTQNIKGAFKAIIRLRYKQIKKDLQYMSVKNKENIKEGEDNSISSILGRLNHE